MSKKLDFLLAFMQKSGIEVSIHRYDTGYAFTFDVGLYDGLKQRECFEWTTDYGGLGYDVEQALIKAFSQFLREFADMVPTNQDYEKVDSVEVSEIVENALENRPRGTKKGAYIIKKLEEKNYRLIKWEQY